MRMWWNCFILLIITLLCGAVQAKIIIWQVGELDNSYEEFVFSDQRVIDYIVPFNWQVMLDQGDPGLWQFPSVLYSNGDNDNNLREIRINSYYPEDYSNPILIIRATTASVAPETHYYLELFKGEIFLGKKLITSRLFYPYDFPLGYIKKGFHEENEIVIRGNGPSDTPIIFDTLYLNLDDTDSDGDGISDVDEGDCYLDQDTVCIPIRSYDPTIIERISLHIEESGEGTQCLRDVRFLEADSLNLPEWLRTDNYLPYGYLGFVIEEIEPHKHVGLQISYNDALYPSARFYSYQDSNNWQEMEFEFLAGNAAYIPLSDGGAGDFDGAKDGAINTILVLSYPRELDIHIEKESCFIAASSWGKNNGTDL